MSRMRLLYTLAFATALALPAFSQGAPSYRQASQIPARIVDFKADKTSIASGDAVMLIWATENPTRLTIEPEPGRVTPRGNKLVMPLATTTYKLTLNGPNNQVLTKEVTVTVTGAAKAAAAASVTHPDLSGIYDSSFGARPAAGAAGAAAAPAAPEVKPGAEKFRVTRGPTDAGPTANCLPLAGPQAFSVPYQFQLVASAKHLAILNEYPGTFRIIPIGVPHQVDPDPSWMGDSVARWDGNTLVIDSIGFNDKTEISNFRHTEDLHIVERLRKTADGSLEYEATVEDPNVWVRPWVVKRTHSVRSDLDKIGEFVCENNPDYSGLFGKK
jgi:hypothetical protein